MKELDRLAEISSRQNLHGIELVNYLKGQGDKGDHEALWLLGYSYDFGFTTGIEKDKSKAKDYYEKAVKAGSKYAHLNLGILLYQSNQSAASIEQIKIAAEYNIPEAISQLASWYMRGDGPLPQNNDKALELYLKAEKMGDEHAIFTMKKIRKASGGSGCAGVLLLILIPVALFSFIYL